MTKEDLKNRTKKFSSDIIKFTELLPSTRAANVICNRILRSATSVGANYRAACKTGSKPDFISKIQSLRRKQTKPYFGWNYC